MMKFTFKIQWIFFSSEITSKGQNEMNPPAQFITEAFVFEFQM